MKQSSGTNTEATEKKYVGIVLVETSHCCSPHQDATFTINPCFTIYRIETLDLSDDENDEDLPVQGPLPEEPEDGPWRRNESGIRKL